MLKRFPSTRLVLLSNEGESVRKRQRCGKIAGAREGENKRKKEHKEREGERKREVGERRALKSLCIHGGF